MSHRRSQASLDPDTTLVQSLTKLAQSTGFLWPVRDVRPERLRGRLRFHSSQDSLFVAASSIDSVCARELRIFLDSDEEEEDLPSDLPRDRSQAI